jgi:hypothetical protein
VTIVFASEATIVLVVVSIDQFAVYHLLASACSGCVFAEIRVWAAEITKQGQRLSRHLVLLFPGDHIFIS